MSSSEDLYDVAVLDDVIAPDPLEEDTADPRERQHRPERGERVASQATCDCRPFAGVIVRAAHTRANAR